MIGPRSMGASTPARHDFQRQNSTKHLIDQFERLATPSPLTPPLNRTRTVIGTPRRTGGVYGIENKSTPWDSGSLATPHEAKKRDRSPIRQSLKNLLSVLKKGSSGLVKRKSDDKLALPPGRPPLVTTGEAESGHKRTYSDISIPMASPSTSKGGSKKKESDTLLYLTRGTGMTPDTLGPLLWAACTVSLDDGRLLVSSFTPDLDLCIHEITLSKCTDIRSLALSQLSEEEAALLDKVHDSDNIRIFELLFEGRVREKFAARSVRERAGWISAIWDAILPGHETNETIKEQDLPQAPLAEPEATQVKSPIPTPIPEISSLLQASYSERSLPPLPLKETPHVLPNLYIPQGKIKNPKLDQEQCNLPLTPLSGPISPSIYPPTTQPASSCAGSSVNTNSCPNSPSIANLSHLSVVRQRLAQIERKHSELSFQSGCTTPVGLSPGPVSPSAWSRNEAGFRSTNSRISPRFGESIITQGDVVVVQPQTPSTFNFKLRDNDTTPQPSSNPDTAPPGRKKRHSKRKYLTEHLASKADMEKVSNSLADIKGVLGGESGYPTVHQMVAGLDQRMQGDGQTLVAIRETLSELGGRVERAANATAAATNASPPVSGDDNREALHVLEDIRSQLEKVFPEALDRLTMIRDTQAKEKEGTLEQSVTLHNIGTSLSTDKGARPEPPEKVDLGPVLEKMEEIKQLCMTEANATARESSGKQEHDKSEDRLPPEQLDKILSRLDEDDQRQTALLQQQGESVRYLNELNSWLESFVNNGTSQIQQLSANVDQLCLELGVGNPQPGVPRVPEDTTPNLLNDIRQLVIGMTARDQNFAALQGAVHSLLEVLTVSQTQRGADTQAIAGLIDRQRRDQEAVFRAFTNEISGEIKGERLRFVEAMKEATAINVQIHVEQFKQELNREVMSMTEQVGKLHKEKQVIENQISDLLAFYSKQKQNATMPADFKTGDANSNTEPQNTPPANLTRSYRRPLPYPKHS